MLTDGDKIYIPMAHRGAGQWHLATKWYLRNWTPLPYQWAWHQIEVPNTTVVAGIATGKTTMVAASYLLDCLCMPYFRALNTSVTTTQAELPLKMIMAWVDGNPKLEHWIEDIQMRPFPMIKFKNYSEFEFRTSGVDARFIRGSEYDRINFDECALDPYGEIVKVLRGRLRGTRPDGANTSRMARLDATTSPLDVPWLRERFSKGIAGDRDEDLENYRSLRVATWDNTFLTRRQVEAMKAEYPTDLIDVEMGGNFPDYGTSMFTWGHLQQNIDQSMYDAMYLALNPEDIKGTPLPGYALEEDPRHGIIKFELPMEPGKIYILAGDPGAAGSVPKRDTGVVGVADVSQKPYRLVYFHWITGKGSYNPFFASFNYALGKYDPVLKGIDATGQGAGLDELAFRNNGIETDKINFTKEKTPALNALVMDITNQRWRVPPIAGWLRQHSNYTIEADRKGAAQDIVMMMAELSWLAKFIPDDGMVSSVRTAKNIYDRKQRTTTGRRRRHS